MMTSRLVGASVLCLATAACTATPASTTPSVVASTAPASGERTGQPIARAEIETAQRAWCDALIGIGQEAANGGDARARAKAKAVIASAYAYDDGGVLFKPTLTYGEQTFRMTKEGALAYFVGGDPAYPNDTGFALKQWKRCEPKIAGVVASVDMAVAMGNVYFTDVKGNEVMVDKTFGYRRGENGALKIALHHSSLPYSPSK